MTRRRKTSKAPEAWIWFSGNGMRVAPSSLLPLLGPPLSCLRHRYQHGGRLGYHAIVERVQFWHNTGKTLLVPAGFLSLVEEVLSEHGVHVHLDPARIGSHEAVDQGRLALFPKAARTLVEAIAPKRQGLVVVRRVEESPWLCRALMAGFPQDRILFIAAGEKRARTLQRQLRNATCVDIGWVPKRRAESDRRWAAATVVSSFHKTGDEWEMFVYPRARDALGKMATYPLLTSPRKRLVGFLTLDEYFALSEYEAMHLKAVFGPVLHPTDAVAWGRHDVEVAMVPPPDGVAQTNADGPLTRKRAMWSDQPRNRLVAQLARAVLARDKGRLGQAGLTLSKAIDALEQSPRVVVLVESAEHARRLQAELPDWRLAVADRRTPETLPAKREGRPHGTIVTAAAGRGTFDAEVVVLADGGTLSAERKERWFASCDWPLGMLDLADAVLGRVEERIEAYQRRGWAVDGVRRVIEPKARPRKASSPVAPVDWLEEQFRLGAHDMTYVLED